jgi:hypothetical protein
MGYGMSCDAALDKARCNTGKVMLVCMRGVTNMISLILVGIVISHFVNWSSRDTLQLGFNITSACYIVVAGIATRAGTAISKHIYNIMTAHMH